MSTQREFSQKTYNLLPSGDWDRKITYSDGTSDNESGNIGRRARKGDLKHEEHTWRDNAWVLVNRSYY